jgi:hypothetical protein
MSAHAFNLLLAWLGLAWHPRHPCTRARPRPWLDACWPEDCCGLRDGCAGGLLLRFRDGCGFALSNFFSSAVARTQARSPPCTRRCHEVHAALRARLRSARGALRQPADRRPPVLSRRGRGGEPAVQQPAEPRAPVAPTAAQACARRSAVQQGVAGGDLRRGGQGRSARGWHAQRTGGGQRLSTQSCTPRRTRMHANKYARGRRPGRAP